VRNMNGLPKKENECSVAWVFKIALGLMPTLFVFYGSMEKVRSKQLLLICVILQSKKVLVQETKIILLELHGRFMDFRMTRGFEVQHGLQNHTLGGCDCGCTDVPLKLLLVCVVVAYGEGK
jgi:hypothetical protein